MKFFSSENWSKAGWWVIFFVLAMIIPTAISGYTSREGDIKNGAEAYRQNQVDHPRFERKIDSAGTTVKEGMDAMRQEWREFRLERNIKDSVIIGTLVEIKTDLKEKK